jgi:hypothetical protein
MFIICKWILGTRRLAGMLTFGWVDSLSLKRASSNYSRGELRVVPSGVPFLFPLEGLDRPVDSRNYSFPVVDGCFLL